MIGKAIQRYRKLKRYTQAEVGEHMGLSQFAISCIERGQRKVSSDELVKFSKLLECKVTDLLMSSQIHVVHEKERTSVDEESIPSTRLDS